MSVGFGEVLATEPALVRLFAGPSGVDEVSAAAFGGSQQLEGLEALAGLDLTGTLGETFLEFTRSVGGHFHAVDLHDAHGGEGYLPEVSEVGPNFPMTPRVERG